VRCHSPCTWADHGGAKETHNTYCYEKKQIILEKKRGHTNTKSRRGKEMNEKTIKDKKETKKRGKIHSEQLEGEK
jgi:hypothetical protein